MSTLIVNNHQRVSEALVRYMQYCCKQDSYAIATFQQFENFWIYNLVQTETLIMDIYSDAEGKFISKGILLGQVFWSSTKNLVWYYTSDGLIHGLNRESLPPNVFYLPLQLNEFLFWLRNPKPVSYKETQIQCYFLSQSFTNDHN